MTHKTLYLHPSCRSTEINIKFIVANYAIVYTLYSGLNNPINEACVYMRNTESMHPLIQPH